MVMPAKYPWDDWFASTKPIHIDTYHYDVAPRSLQIQTLTEARKRNIKVATSKCPTHRDCLVVHPRRAMRTDWNAFFREVIEQQLAGRQHAVWKESLRTCHPDSFIRRARAQAATRGYTLRVDQSTNGSAIGFTVDVNR